MNSAYTAFDGYYGMRNTGDDVFCAVAAERAVRRWGLPSARFLAASRDLPVTGVPQVGLLPASARFRGHIRFASVAATLGSHLVVHVGGSTFMQPLRKHRDQVLLARTGTVELHAVGVSVGPFTDPRRARDVGHILGHFSSVSVRDIASAERLSEVAPKILPQLGFDVAVLLEPDQLLQGERPRATRPVLGVSLCAHESARGVDADAERSRLDRTLEMVRRCVAATGAEVRVLVLNDHPRWGDATISRRFVENLPFEARILSRTNDPRDMAREIAECSAVVATRLHAGILAFSAGVPFVLIAYQQKSVDFAQTIGLDEDLVFDRFGPDPIEGAGVLQRMLESKSPPSMVAPEAARERAEMAFSAVDRRVIGNRWERE